MFERTGKHKKKQKNIFFNYFLIYLVAIIVIIALNTKNIILIIRCRINRNCFDIYSRIKLDGLSLKIFLYNPVPNKKNMPRNHCQNTNFVLFNVLFNFIQG